MDFNDDRKKISEKEPSIATFDEVPILDASALVNNEDITTFSKTLREACENMGFFYVKNHGIPKNVIDGAFDASKTFFSLSLNDKRLTEESVKSGRVKSQTSPFTLAASTFLANPSLILFATSHEVVPLSYSLTLLSGKVIFIMLKKLSLQM